MPKAQSRLMHSGFIEAGGLLWLLTSLPSVAQIVPDTTLPMNSLVTTEDNIILIEEGTAKGSNLFQSFEQFSVPTGNTAYFNNSVAIENIFSRVTGSSISNIDGTLRANGTANLFLLNPNGIIFGPNAQLNIGGSFLGSTASSINFSDGIQFSAAPQTTPLLSVNVPIGLGLGSNPGTIRVKDVGHDLRASGTSAGNTPLLRGNTSRNRLQVQQSKTLALVGGDINLEGGILTAEGGRIELGSVDSGIVDLNSTSSGLTLGYQNISNFKDIQMSQRSLADASGTTTGSIKLQGKRVSLSDGSIILLQNQGLPPAGAIEINASKSLEISGTDPVAKVIGSLVNETLGFAAGGDITIFAPQLILQNGGTITTRTFGMSKAGNINISVPQLLQVIGTSPRDYRALSTIYSVTFGSGNAGDVKVITGQLSATGGGRVASATSGTGAGGNVTVEATDSVKLIGVEQNLLAPSSIGATTISSGDAGGVTISTPRLILKDGGRVDSSTGASGKAGSVTIDAKESVQLDGTVPGSRNPSLVISSANILDESFRMVLGLPSKPTGVSGNVSIDTKQLSITNGGRVSVGNEGTGDAGSLRVNADLIKLDSNGSITAASASGEGGNIFLRSRDLQLIKGSNITTSVTGGMGNGGNINLDTDLLTLTQGSSITANAFAGNGGNIKINTSGLFQSPDSPITASSQLGINGTVQFNRIENSPASGTIELPQNTVDATGLIVQACPGNLPGQSSSFTITGRGGRIEDPYQPLIVQPEPWVDLGSFDSTENKPSKPASQEDNSSKDKIEFSPSKPVSFVEADRVSRDPQGNFVLSSSAPQRQSLPSLGCELLDPTDK